MTPTDAATYLRQPLAHPPPAPWKAISDHLITTPHTRRTSPLSEALKTPLTLSLLRDVYGPTSPVHELLDTSRFPTAADIENHLLDHAITTAYTPRPGHPRPRYTVATAQRTLRYLATQLTEHDTRDLAWWHIPTWTTHRSRIVRAVVVGTLMNGLASWLVLGVGGALLLGLLSGLGVGLTVGLRRGVPTTPTRIARPTYRFAPRKLGIGIILYGTLFVLAVGLVVGLASGPMSGLLVGLWVGLILASFAGLTIRTELDGGSFGPADVWRHDRNAGLGTWLVFVLAGWLAGWLVPGLAAELVFVFASGLVFVLLAGFVFVLVFERIVELRSATENVWGSATFDTAAVLAHLAIRHKIPLRLIAFLEDARSKHLLRTVGPVYQFRHAKLQDRLTQPPVMRTDRA